MDMSLIIRLNLTQWKTLKIFFLAHNRKQIQVFIKKFLQRILKIYWTNTFRNKDLWKITNFKKLDEENEIDKSYGDQLKTLPISHFLGNRKAQKREVIYGLLGSKLS